MNDKTSATNLSRRALLAQGGACLATTVLAQAALGAEHPTPEPAAGVGTAAPFRLCLNTATIRGHKLPIAQEVEIAAKAGYDGIEPWMDGINRHVEAGGSLADLGKRIADLGLVVESAIGFPNWGVDDPEKRAAGLEQMRRDMERVCAIGSKRIAAPPAGLWNIEPVDLRSLGERYRIVLELGDETGVLPQLEIWGGARTLGRLSEAIFVAVESGRPDACLLLDAYHLYRGGSGFDGLHLLNGAAMHMFHINDYPAEPEREQLKDSHRLLPGDGVCPLPEMLRTMHTTGFRGTLSLELFNRDLWDMDPLEAARLGREKMEAVIAAAGF
ncbi:MAG: sugar phosphate isomerase/epimerase family protein [Thermoguttaceae bacterium]|jgi:sugar phosphate isomerase/epimerase|nr:sugar phosphate isomerase/epimerase family protein [Thermoguttaceae bacterium]